MKTIAAFTMALATLVLATAADADTQDQRCFQRGRGLSVRAGTPCVFRLLPPRISNPNQTFRHAEIIRRPNNGTAVLRPDGTIYYSPKPGFTGRDGLRVRSTDCDLRYYPACGEAYVIFVE
jgi:hypothetical protein